MTGPRRVLVPRRQTIKTKTFSSKIILNKSKNTTVVPVIYTSPKEEIHYAKMRRRQILKNVGVNSPEELRGFPRKEYENLGKRIELIKAGIYTYRVP